jgi:hypothetical protein
MSRDMCERCPELRYCRGHLDVCWPVAPARVRSALSWNGQWNIRPRPSFNVASSGPLSTVIAPPVQPLRLSRGGSLASASGRDHVTSRRASAAERVAGRYRAPGEQSTQPLRRHCPALAGPKPAGTTDSPNSAPAAQLDHALRGAPMWSEFWHPGSSTLVVRVLRLVVHGVPPAEVAGVASVLPWR